MSQGPYKRDGETVYATEPASEQSDKTDSDAPKYKDKEWLYHQYHILNKSSATIANELGVGDSTICAWIDKHGIETRPNGISQSYSRRPDGKWRNESWLRAQYDKNGKSMAEIAREADTSRVTIRQWLIRHGIDRRPPGFKPPKYYDEKQYADEEWLREQYLELQKEMPEIAEECGVSAETIRQWIEKHGIEVRSRSEINLLRHGSANAVPKRDGASRELVQDDLSIDASWKDISERNVSGSWVPYRDEDWLREHYCDQEKTMDEMAEMCGVSKHTIRRWLDRYDIESRDMTEVHSPDNASDTYQDWDWLYDQYWNKGKIQTEIADQCDVSQATIKYWMKKHGIETRS